MTIRVLSLLSAISLISYGSCHSNTKSEAARIIWKLPHSRENPEAKIGKQMPPHHEPDAVLINTRGNGKPQVPEGNFPQFPGGPGVFGFPRPGGGPVNRRGFFPVPRLPTYPNPFGIPGGQAFPGIPNNPGVFFSPGQGGPLMPNGPNAYGVPVSQNGPGFTVRTGYFVPNGEPSGTGDSHIFGQPGIFAVAGSENVPFPALPEFFFRNRGSNAPEANDNNFPPVRGMAPEAPAGRRNDFQPGFNSNGNFPRHEFYGGAGGREIYDDPAAEAFPIIEASNLFYDIMYQH